MLKPFSQACVNNRDAILQQLQCLLANSTSVLEIGSGSGQHAVYFAEALEHLQWQTSDLADNHHGIHLWLDEYSGSNCLPPLNLDISQTQWFVKPHDVIFAANILHIMSCDNVALFFNNLKQALHKNGLVIIYGPFKYEGNFTSESNARFDQWLQAANPLQGIRDIEYIEKLAKQNDLYLLDDIAMPANNRLRVWQYGQ